MKKQITLILTLLAVAIGAMAQSTIYLCKTDGTFEKFNVADVDSICFSDPMLGTNEGYQWVDLGLSVKWALHNVGATDTLSYGDYYAWGEVAPKSDYSKANYAFANLDTIIATYDSLVLRLPQADSIDEYDTILYKVYTDSLAEFDVICDTIYTDYDSVRVVVTAEIKAQLTDSISNIEGVDSLMIEEMVDAALLTKAALIDSLVAAADPIQDIVNCRDTLPYSVVLHAYNIIEYTDTLEVVDTIQFVDTIEVVLENQFLKYNQYDRIASLEDADEVVKKEWGGAWRIPTKAELRELVDSCKWEWVKDSIGTKDITVKVDDKDSTYTATIYVFAYKVTGPNGYYIYLPAAGYKYANMSIPDNDTPNYVVSEEDAKGYYWSSELSFADREAAFAVSFDKSGISKGNMYRVYGRSIRPVMPRK